MSKVQFPKSVVTLTPITMATGKQALALKLAREIVPTKEDALALMGLVANMSEAQADMFKNLKATISANIPSLKSVGLITNYARLSAERIYHDVPSKEEYLASLEAQKPQAEEGAAPTEGEATEPAKAKGKKRGKKVEAEEAPQ